MSYSNLPFFVLWEDYKSISLHPNVESRKFLEPGRLYGIHNNLSAPGVFFTRGSYVWGSSLTKVFDLTGAIRADEYLLKKYKIKEGDTLYYNDQIVKDVKFDVKYIADKYQIVLFYMFEYITLDNLQTLDSYRNNIIDDILR